MTRAERERLFLELFAGRTSACIQRLCYGYLGACRKSTTCSRRS